MFNGLRIYMHLDKSEEATYKLKIYANQTATARAHVNEAWQAFDNERMRAQITIRFRYLLIKITNS